MLAPGLPEDPLPRFDQRFSRRVIQPFVGKEEVREVALPVLLVQVRHTELEPLQTCTASFEPSPFKLEGTREFVHAARVTRGTRSALKSRRRLGNPCPSRWENRPRNSGRHPLEPPRWLQI